MELWIGIAAAGTALMLGFVLGVRLGTNAAKLEKVQLDRMMSSDRRMFLRAIQREIANTLMRRSHWRFVQTKRRALAEVERIAQLPKADASHELAVVSKTYPLYRDFQPFETRDHVLYADAASSLADEDLETYYLDLVRFMALQKHFDANAAHEKIATDSDLEHAIKYAQRVEDALFERRLKDAVNLYFLRLRDDDGFFAEFTNKDFTVRPVYHFAENRYGVSFKKPEEYGLVGMFHGERERPYVSYFRTDPSFGQETGLNPLRAADLFWPAPKEED